MSRYADVLPLPGPLRAHLELNLLCVVVCTKDDPRKNATHSTILISKQSQSRYGFATTKMFKAAQDNFKEAQIPT
jgi:hypothetical protein